MYGLLLLLELRVAQVYLAVKLISSVKALVIRLPAAVGLPVSAGAKEDAADAVTPAGIPPVLAVPAIMLFVRTHFKDIALLCKLDSANVELVAGFSVFD
jgi:hypothetical protein